MVKTDIPEAVEKDASPDVLLSRLQNEGVMRYEELVNHDTLQTRRTLDTMEIDGVIDRFAVGDHIMVKLEADAATTG